VTGRRRAHGGALILGGGYAGAWVARYLRKHAATIVSVDNFMLFTPVLPEAASGTLEPRHAVVPLRMMCPHAELVLGRVVSLDETAHLAAVQTGVGLVEIEYEDVVIALGAVPRTFPIPGLREHGVGFKSLADAIHLRNHVLRELEAAAAEPDQDRVSRHLAYVFVGGGYAGVEALAELNDLVQDALRFYPRLRHVRQRWVLVDAAPRVLHEIPTRLGEYAARQLEKRGIEIRCGTQLVSAEGGHVVLSDGEHIEAGTLVWTAGVKANPLLGELGLPLDDRGRLQVDEHLRVVGRRHVWALGDCAAVTNAATPGRTDPPTCQHALRQARRLARNLVAAKDGREPKPFHYRTLGQAATLGRHKGIADVLGLPLSGFAGWFFTRTYHLFQLPLFSRKLRVVADWTTSLLFRRDIAELGTLGHRQPLP
jgi:NADH:ubiquinone reductase (H+-translocating)